jgi:outer membrane protein assembly factor BamE
MKFASRSLLALLLTVSLAGCSNFRFPWVHKINVQQGHIVTQEMVDQLKVGMSKRQVRFVLGNSLLPNTFNDDRWEYPYSVRKGSDGEITSYLFTVYFDNDKMTRYEGDYLPGRAPMSSDKSERYLEDNRRDMPLPLNDEELPEPEAPEEVQEDKE